MGILTKVRRRNKNSTSPPPTNTPASPTRNGIAIGQNRRATNSFAVASKFAAPGYVRVGHHYWPPAIDSELTYSLPSLTSHLSVHAVHRGKRGDQGDLLYRQPFLSRYASTLSDCNPWLPESPVPSLHEPERRVLLRRLRALLDALIRFFTQLKAKKAQEEEVGLPLPAQQPTLPEVQREHDEDEESQVQPELPADVKEPSTFYVERHYVSFADILPNDPPVPTVPFNTPNVSASSLMFLGAPVALVSNACAAMGLYLANTPASPALSSVSSTGATIGYDDDDSPATSSPATSSDGPSIETPRGEVANPIEAPLVGTVPTIYVTPAVGLYLANAPTSPALSDVSSTGATIFYDVAGPPVIPTSPTTSSDGPSVDTPNAEVTNPIDTPLVGTVPAVHHTPAWRGQAPIRITARFQRTPIGNLFESLPTNLNRVVEDKEILTQFFKTKADWDLESDTEDDKIHIKAKVKGKGKAKN